MPSQTAIRKSQTRKVSKVSKGVKPMVFQVIENMERETGIEPATNSLEGCDSTTELLPLAFVFNNFQCALMASLCANGAKWRYFAQSLHKVEDPLHKCTKSAYGHRCASCLESPFRFTNISKSTTAFHVSGATCSI